MDPAGGHFFHFFFQVLLVMIAQADVSSTGQHGMPSADILTEGVYASAVVDFRT